LGFVCSHLKWTRNISSRFTIKITV